jgi:hypothetical protein
MRKTAPRAAADAAGDEVSMSSLLVPTLPMCGKVGDDLGGVGGVGQDLLIARHRGVEADLESAAPIAKGLRQKTEPSASPGGRLGRRIESNWPKRQ